MHSYKIFSQLKNYCYLFSFEMQIFFKRANYGRFHRGKLHKSFVREKSNSNPNSNFYSNSNLSFLVEFVVLNLTLILG